MIFTQTQELYLREKVELANKVMHEIGRVIPHCPVSCQNDLSDIIVDILSISEGLYYHIDVNIVLSRKIDEARSELIKLKTELHETKSELADTRGKLVRSLEQPL